MSRFVESRENLLWSYGQPDTPREKMIILVRVSIRSHYPAKCSSYDEIALKRGDWDLFYRFAKNDTAVEILYGHEALWAIQPFSDFEVLITENPSPQRISLANQTHPHLFREGGSSRIHFLNSLANTYIHRDSLHMTYGTYWFDGSHDYSEVRKAYKYAVELIAKDMHSRQYVENYAMLKRAELMFEHEIASRKRYERGIERHHNLKILSPELIKIIKQWIYFC